MHTHNSIRTAVAVAFSLVIGLAPALALAEGSPCAPTAEQLEAYEADGTLAERQAYAEALGLDEPSQSLIDAALEREAGNDTALLSIIPDVSGLGMATTGSAHVLVLQVDFPDQKFQEGDTAEALQALFGPTAEGEAAATSPASYPYESLSAYYERSSYGKLHITAEVFSYTAAHERDYYTTDIFLLFDEAIQALDATEDLSRFDANNDGYFDGVYLHFAGMNTGWGSTWWSNCQNFEHCENSYEGGSLHVARAVTLHEQGATTYAAQTLIHETGHVLGLPDYYSYISTSSGEGTSSSAGAAALANTDSAAVDDRTGMLTFDMMMDNLGDHCGFSKWLLGWLDSDDITYVVVNEDGVTATRGGAVVATAAPDELIDLDLGAFTSDDAKADTGGIIVLANEEGGVLGDYYVLQYDHCAGNQTVSYADAAYASGISLPNGFRLYRVQASLNEYGSFKAYNTSGSVHNQLVELVDPDEGTSHVGSTGTYIQSAAGSDDYGCMLYAGSTVTPTTYPSTNFYENANLGFTGIALEVTACNDASGTVRVGYSSEGKPDVDKGLELASAEGQLVGTSGTLSFTASMAPQVSTGTFEGVKLMVDGEEHALGAPSVEGTTVSIGYRLNAEDIGASSSCEIVFPAGLFELYRVGGTVVASQEIRISLDVDPTLAAISESGFYDNAMFYSFALRVSEPFERSDGSTAFALLDDAQLCICTLGSDDPDSCAVTLLVPSEQPVADNISRLSALELDDGTVFVAVANSSDGSLTCWWFNGTTGVLLASQTFAERSDAQFISDGKAVVSVSGYEPSGALLTSMTLDSEGGVELHYGWTSAWFSYAASLSSLALAPMDIESGATTAVELVDADKLANALAKSDCDIAGAMDAGDVCAGIVRLTIEPEEGRAVLAVGEGANSVAVLYGGARSADGTSAPLLVRYDAEGNELARTEVDGAYDRITVGEHGAVALSAFTYGSYGVTDCKTLLYDASLQAYRTLGTRTPAAGCWLSDGRWFNANSAFFDFNSRVHYNVTEAIDVEPEPDPDPKPDPTPEPDPDPDPTPDPEPTPDPDPTPDPEPTPDPDPIPDPDPEPAADPDLEPTTEPTNAADAAAASGQAQATLSSTLPASGDNSLPELVFVASGIAVLAVACIQTLKARDSSSLRSSE